MHRLTDWHRSITKIHEDLRDTDISDRQIDGLIFALHTGQITRADYIEIAGVSPITATRDLARLARGKLLVAEGKTRSRVYRLSKSLIPNNSEPPPESSDWRQPNLIPEGRIGRGWGPYQQIEDEESGPSRSPASAPS